MATSWTQTKLASNTRKIKHTLGELSCNEFELKPKTKLASWLPLPGGIQHIDADTHITFPSKDTESIIFWNSACPKMNDRKDINIKIPSTLLSSRKQKETSRISIKVCIARKQTNNLGKQAWELHSKAYS